VDREPAIERLFDEKGRIDLAAVAKLIGQQVARLAPMTSLTPHALRKNPTSDKAQPAGRRFVEILSSAVYLFGGMKPAMIWMRYPRHELGGESPLAIALKGEFGAVEGLLHDILSGQPG
jgi:uncharacterized protein (DUF2384 family)